MGFGFWKTLVQMPALSQALCMTFGKHFPKIPFSHLKMHLRMLSIGSYCEAIMKQRIQKAQSILPKIVVPVSLLSSFSSLYKITES